ncbi:MAG: ABC transporter ATP-binding protein [Pseudomonadota bacterium]
MSDVVLELDGVERAFGDLVIVDRADLQVRAGEIVGLVGPSGSGKSSLLHIAGLLEKPSGGVVKLLGRDASNRSDRDRTALRRDVVGFVYQFHHLLPEFDALSNVALPRRIAGRSKKDAETEAARLLSALGLGERLRHQPAQLSGGEQQRVAVARALANGPRLLLADEPTGNLDPATSGAVFDALLNLVRSEGLAALIATHDHALAARMDRVVSIENKRLVESRNEQSAAE